MSGDWHSQSLSMGDDCFEVLYADHDVHIFLHVEVVEVFSMYRNGGLQRLFKHFYNNDQHQLRPSWWAVHTFAILYLFCEAREDGFTFLSKYIKLLGLRRKVLNVLSKDSRGYLPPLGSRTSIEESVHDFGGLVREAIRLRHAWQCKLGLALV